MMSSRLKHITFSLVIISVVILVNNNLYFTINHTRKGQDYFHFVNIYLSSLRDVEWLSRDNIGKRIEMEVMDMDSSRDKNPSHANNTVIPYLKRVKNPTWFEIVAREFKNEAINIGLVNMDAAMDGVQTKAKMMKVHFERVRKDIGWSDLFPELVFKNSTCPNIPMPKFEDYRDLDVVVARIPHGTGYGKDGMKDVSWLQVNLVVANLLVQSGRKGNGPVLAVFVESYNPAREIFRCDDLLWNEGNTWIYKPEMRRIKKLVAMPVGSCQFVPPLSNFSKVDQELQRRQTYNGHLPREAYVTILHSSEDYVCGAIVLAQSIKQTNTTKDLILLADDHISTESIQALRAVGWKTQRIKRIRSPFSKKDSYNEWNYSKLRMWQLKQYDKLMFIDADLLVIRNLDEFFIYPQLSAAGNYQKHLFNSGLMLVEPSQCTYETLMKNMEVVESYNGGDQGFLNEMFVWWHRLPHEINVMKVFLDEDSRKRLIRGIYTIHYTGLKPWKCAEEEHDCNWDLPGFRRYASDVNHRMWWRVYRKMPEKQRLFCSMERGRA